MLGCSKLRITSGSKTQLNLPIAWVSLLGFSALSQNWAARTSLHRKSQETKQTDTRRPKTARQQPPVLRDVHASPLAITHYQGFVPRPMAVVTHTVVMRLAAQTALAFLPGDGAHARRKPVLMGCNVRLEFHHSQPMSPQNGWIWMNMDEWKFQPNLLSLEMWRLKILKHSLAHTKTST